MKITAIRDTTVSIRSQLRNAFISFAEMTVSAVVVITDIVCHGRPVVGCGFHSNGRYGQSALLLLEGVLHLLASVFEAGLRLVELAFGFGVLIAGCLAETFLGLTRHIIDFVADLVVGAHQLPLSGDVDTGSELNQKRDTSGSR